MESIDWFKKPPAPKPEGIGSAALKAAIGLGVAALFYARGHRILAGVAAGLAVLFFVLSLAPAGRAALGKVFGLLGEWLGRIVGTVLLSLIFIFVLTPVRLFRWITGTDELRLRDTKERSYWLPCDDEEHKRRHAAAMFATEVRGEGGGRRWLAIVVGLAVTLVGLEIGLRAAGYGHPPVYVSDPITGYHLAPNLRTSWRGARFESNRFGMRAPERDPKKAKGALRVLELSTDGGLRIDQDAIFGRQLEKRLAEKTAGRGSGAIEVWNADVAGWGPPSMRGYVELFGSFEADVAIFTITRGGLAPTKQSLLDTPYFPADRPPRLALEETFLDLLYQYRGNRTAIDASLMQTLQTLGAAELGRMARTLRSRGVEPLLVIATPLDGLADADKAPYTQAIEAVQRAGGRAVIVPASFAAGHIDPESGTLTAAGHAALADTVAAELLEASLTLRAWLGGKAP